MEADPLSASPWEDLAEVLMGQGNYEESRAVHEEIRRKFGDNDRQRERRAMHALARGDNAAALAILERGFDFQDDFNYLAPLKAALQGHGDEALRLAAEFEAYVGWPHYGLMDTYSVLGEREKLRDLIVQVDRMPAGAMILGLHVASSGSNLLFDLDDAPNFRQRLKEAQIDPASFEFRTWETSQ